MSRWPFLFQYVTEDLLEAGLAMLDGSYWKDPRPWEDVGADRALPEPNLGSWE